MLHQAGDHHQWGSTELDLRPCTLYCLHRSLAHRTQKGTKFDDETKLRVTVDSLKGRESPQRDMNMSEG